MRTSDKSREILVIFLLVILAAGLRICGIWWGLPEVYEEATPLREAWGIWGWGANDTFDLNPHFFHYPSLTIYAQFIGQAILYLGMRMMHVVDSTLGFRVQYVVDQTPFLLVGRLITVLFSIASVWIIYRTGKKIGGRPAAVTAALLLAVNAFHISKSQVVEVDVPLAFFVVLTFWFLVRLIGKPTMKSYIFSGVSLGLAVSTKYTAALLVLSLLAAHLIARRNLHDSKRQRKARKSEREAWKRFSTALVVAALVFFVTSPFVIIDASTASRHLAIERQHMRVGHFGVGTSGTWLYYLRSLSERLLGWPLLLVFIGAIVYLAGLRRRSWAIVIVSFCVPYLLAVSSWAMRADRYLMPIVVPAMLLAGGMVSEGLELYKRRWGAGKLRYGLCALLVLLLAVMPLAGYSSILDRLTPDTRTVAKEWIEENVPSGAFVVSEAYGPEFLSPPRLYQVSQEVRRGVMKELSGRPNYAVLPVPMFQVKPERSEAFYDIRLYETADLFITSSWVQSRYVSEPSRFGRQVAFYEDLDAEFRIVRRFTPDRGPGPTLTIYRNPRYRHPFAARKTVGGPRALEHERKTPSGSEELFYSNLGANYEAFGFFEHALASYMLAFDYPVLRPANYKKLVLGIVRCLLTLKRTEDALAFLGEAAAAAPDLAVRAEIEHFRGTIRARIQQGK
jgi:4-amino-4-deoxy-L-arabinose transferase-like glycosyltransferase